MSIRVSPTITERERSKAIGTGAVLGMAGMTAYYLPIARDRFVRTAYSIVKNNAEDKIETLNDAAIALGRNNLRTEHKVFLAQEGVAETIDAINGKIAELKHSITDKDTVKALKQNFADNFATFKKTEALADPISSKALQTIKWRNFGWGAAIGFVLGTVIGMRMDEASNNSDNLAEY